MVVVEIVNFALGLLLVTTELLKCLLVLICSMPHIKALKSCFFYYTYGRTQIYFT
jgi:hypothetical protein